MEDNEGTVPEEVLEEIEAYMDAEIAGNEQSELSEESSQDETEQAFATEDDNTEGSSATAFLVGALFITAAEVGDCG